jgi:DNA-binding CsgD family transcriptional regulator
MRRRQDEGKDTARLRLTPRQKQVLHWVVRGKGNAEIAGILHISPETVRKHVEKIRKEYKSESRISIIATYWQRVVDARDRVIRRLRRKKSHRQ